MRTFLTRTAMLLAVFTLIGGSLYFGSPTRVQANGGNTFKIESLSESPLYATDTEAITGDSKGGIGYSAERVFVRGDDGIGSYNITDFSTGTAADDSDSTWGDAFATDIKTQTTWAFDDLLNMTTLTALDDTTGALTAQVITLAPSITMAQVSGSAIFSGYGRIVLADKGSGKIYDISLPSGTVTLAATISTTSSVFTDFDGNEAPYRWGVAEFFDGDISLVYADAGNETAGDPGRIVRMNVRTGVTENIFSVPEGTRDTGSPYYIGDDPSFTVDCANQRWYLKTEYGDENDWLAGLLPASEDYDEPLYAFSATFSGGSCGSSTEPSITASGTSRVIGAPGSDHMARRATYTWLRCKSAGDALESRRAPRDCRAVQSLRSTGARMTSRPYRITAVDRRAGYLRLAVTVARTTYYSGTFNLNP